MKKVKLFLFLVLAQSVCAQIKYQPTIDKINLGANGENKAYYSLALGTTNVKNTKNELNWHLAFQIDQDRGFGIRVNTSDAIFNVYKTDKTSLSEITNDFVSTYNPSSTDELYNSTQDWNQGALNNDSWDNQTNPNPYYIGWGAYDINTHKVNGTRVFILKHAYYDKGWKKNYYKLKINSRYRNYNFTYSKYNGTAWEAEKTVTLNDLDYRDKGNKFVYYNINTHTVVQEEPEFAWDFLFATYDQNLNKTDKPSDLMYTVTGCLHKYNLEIAETIEEDNEINSNYKNLTYSKNINTIGHDWKEFNFDFYNPGYTMSKKKFYLKASNDKYYRVHFKYNYIINGDSKEREIEILKQELNDELLSVNKVNKENIKVYPTLVEHAKVTIETPNEVGNKTVRLINSVGQIVLEKKYIENEQTIEMELPSSLSNGIYVVQVNVNNKNLTSKIIKN